MPLAQLVEVVVWLSPGDVTTKGAGTCTMGGDATTTGAGTSTTGDGICTIGAGAGTVSTSFVLEKHP